MADVLLWRAALTLPSVTLWPYCSLHGLVARLTATPISVDGSSPQRCRSLQAGFSVSSPGRIHPKGD
jgi:hypothetical protein